MEVNLSIKGVRVSLAQALKERASANHRSLQGELMAIIEAAAQDTRQSFAAVTTNAEVSQRTTRQASSIAKIGAELRKLCPSVAHLAEGESAAEVIRRMRDGRDGSQWRDPQHHDKGY